MGNWARLPRTHTKMLSVVSKLVISVFLRQSQENAEAHQLALVSSRPIIDPASNMGVTILEDWPLNSTWCTYMCDHIWKYKNMYMHTHIYNTCITKEILIFFPSNFFPGLAWIPKMPSNWLVCMSFIAGDFVLLYFCAPYIDYYNHVYKENTKKEEMIAPWFTLCVTECFPFHFISLCAENLNQVVTIMLMELGILLSSLQFYHGHLFFFVTQPS